MLEGGQPKNMPLFLPSEKGLHLQCCFHYNKRMLFIQVSLKSCAKPGSLFIQSHLL